METLAEQPAEAFEQVHEQLGFNRRERTQTDTATWLAEALNGSMRTRFEYSFDGQELYGEDGGAIGEIFDYAIESAQAIVASNPDLLFELRRRLIERGEYEDMIGMAKGELPNTMISVSDYPPELMENPKDVGGYNGRRKQTMLRVIARQVDGSIRMTTQSLDGSNRQALEALYKQMGYTAEPGELLEQRMHVDLPAAWQDKLVDNLTDTYDSSLSEQYGGSWHAGIRQNSTRQRVNTYEFACAQKDLVEWFTAEKLADPIKAEKLRYQLAATIDERYERFVRVSQSVDSGIRIVPQEMSFSFVQAHNLHDEIEQANQRATSKGKTFSGCGTSVKRELSDTDDQLEQSGYGNKTKPEKNIMKCVNCPQFRTFHEELRARKGKFTCRNKKCGYTVNV